MELVVRIHQCLRRCYVHRVFTDNEQLSQRLCGRNQDKIFHEQHSNVALQKIFV